MSKNHVTVAAIGDSALWCTGVRYRDKTPNLVHKLLNDGEPLPPVQFRARGGAVIGVDDCRGSNSFDAEDDNYNYASVKDQLNDWIAQSGRDTSDIDNLAWTIVRDLGQDNPTICQQLRQFPRRGSGDAVLHLDVPYQGQQSVRFYNQSGEFLQAASTQPPHAEDIDLVLVNGGTNDISLDWLLDYSYDYRSLLHKTERYCYSHQIKLLENVRERFPNAVIALVSYFPFLSDWTWYPTAKEYLRTFPFFTKQQAVGTYPGPDLIERVIDNAQVFIRAHQHYMRRAVDERARQEIEQSQPGVIYVSRGFGNVHAMDAAEPWVWGLDNDDTYEVRRYAATEIVGDDKPKYILAGIGHPNRIGSQKTAESIVNRYKESRQVSVREAVKMTAMENGSRPSVNTALNKRSEIFDHQSKKSLRLLHHHRYLDSIHLEFMRSDALKSKWQNVSDNGEPYLHQQSDLYLDIEPGRHSPSGFVDSNPNNLEVFRVDWESDKEAKDTPQFDEHSERKTHIFFDPMMGRHMDSNDAQKRLGQVSVGKEPSGAGKKSQREDNVNNDEGYGTDIEWSETNHGRYNILPNDRRSYYGRHDATRMELASAQKMTLRISNPSYWALKYIKLVLNGTVTFHVDRVGADDLEDYIGEAVERGDRTLQIPLFDSMT